MKKLLGIISTLVVAAFFVVPVHAEEVESYNTIQPRTAETVNPNAREALADDAEIDCEVNPTDESCIMLLDEEPVDNCTPDVTTNCLPAASEGDDPAYASFEECLRSNNEADCAIYSTGNTDDGQIEIIEATGEVEEEAEPAMWPVYISLGALGAAIIIFILLNFFTEQKKK